MSQRTIVVLPLILLLLLTAAPASGAGKKGASANAEEEGPFRSATFSGLALREIGPALTSGRIADLAIDPTDRSTWFAAVASGGVWKTTNAGTTWSPVFDQQGSYSIGCVTIDPNNPWVVWVGTGENNSQRSVSYGDGVYRSRDGGRSWENVGLKASEHIGKIIVDPRDSNRVWVAAQGPLWKSGGDRGLYRTIDGGESWERVLDIDEDTGVTDLVIDPRNPDRLYAASYQRRRRTWTLINGGPGSAIHKSTDGGATWRKIVKGLPATDLGRIGLAIAPAAPDTIYAIVEAERGESGFYRSVDRGENWEKRSDYVSSSPQYYQEIVADPHDPDRVYSLDTWMMVTDDGGKSFERVGNRAKHVDDHALWIDPDDTDHLIAGCDGGAYVSHDRGENWRFVANLPITQFYRVTPDDAEPFYNVYGGTQDNFTLGGPSRTTSENGISNRDWFVTLGGDGFEPQVEPGNPDIVYSQYQYGGLARFDRRSGEILDIQPQPAPGDDPLRWNWDSALRISPHSPTRLYFAAQRLFRSDDRGQSWTPISGDLSRGLDRNALEVMGRVQKVDAVAKNASTSFYGNVVSFDESPLVENLLYAGTDDGLVQVLEPGQTQWRRVDSFPGVPKMSYVADLEASIHSPDVLFAAFDNHKSGDFRPYLLRSEDRGRSWKSIAGDLPERGTVYTVAQDHERKELLFVGTEFGLFFTVDGGKRWTRLAGGIPVIAVRDLEIQRRENDLVLATFGRGIWILDDYSPLRFIDDETLEREALLFPVKRALAYIPSAPLGIGGKSFQGDSFYVADNPPFGATITYYLKEELRSRKKKRKELEQKLDADGESPPYPTWEELRAEDREHDPAMLLIVRDEAEEVVRRIAGPTGAGLQRVSWDLRYPAVEPVRLTPRTPNPFSDPPRGPMAAPGRYSVELARRVDGETTILGDRREIIVEPLGMATLAASDREALLTFQQKVGRLQRAVLGAVRAAAESQRRIDHLRPALDETPAAGAELSVKLHELEQRLKNLQAELSGDSTIRARNEPTPPSTVQRVQRIVSSQWASTSAPTGTNRDAYRIAGSAFEDQLGRLRRLIEVDLVGIENLLEEAGAPWTPGRVPRWSPE